jgi:hypothetical protein
MARRLAGRRSHAVSSGQFLSAIPSAMSPKVTARAK